MRLAPPRKLSISGPKKHLKLLAQACPVHSPECRHLTRSNKAKLHPRAEGSQTRINQIQTRCFRVNSRDLQAYFARIDRIPRKHAQFPRKFRTRQKSSAPLAFPRHISITFSLKIAPHARAQFFKHARWPQTQGQPLCALSCTACCEGVTFTERLWYTAPSRP